MRRSYATVLRAKGFKPLRLNTTIKSEHDVEVVGLGFIRHDPACCWCNEPVRLDDRAPGAPAHKACAMIYEGT